MLAGTPLQALIASLLGHASTHRWMSTPTRRRLPKPLPYKYFDDRASDTHESQLKLPPESMSTAVEASARAEMGCWSAADAVHAVVATRDAPRNRLTTIHRAGLWTALDMLADPS